MVHYSRNPWLYETYAGNYIYLELGFGMFCVGSSTKVRLKNRHNGFYILVFGFLDTVFCFGDFVVHFLQRMQLIVIVAFGNPPFCELGFDSKASFTNHEGWTSFMRSDCSYR